jgi:thiol:disulfide interchange protein DsbD
MRFLPLLLLLASWLGHAADPELLEPDKAFRLAARVAEAGAIEVRYVIAPGYYMYRDKFRFALEPADAKLAEPQLPRGKMKRDQFFGDVETYRDGVTIRLPFEAARSDIASLRLVATSQGCADVGVCYLPQDQKVELRLATLGGAFVEAAPGSIGAAPKAPPGPAVGAAVGEDGVIAALFRGGFWVLIASFFGFGLLLAFTPCVLPMIPILSGIIVGRGHHVTRIQGLLLSAVYVLGMALTYALAGMAAGLSGAMLAATLQSPWVLGGFAAVFVVLALSMFGFYELQLPVALQSRLAAATNRLPGGRFAGVFSMGILSALIIGPCVAAPLAGALLYMSQSRDVMLGGSALFAMALGMGVPLLAVGASAGALLPKAGPWMETVKRFFGVMMLAVAIYLVSPFIPVVAQMLAWGILLMVTAVYLRALDPLPVNAHGFERFSKAIGVIALVTGAGFLLGALAGGRDVLQPLSGLRVGQTAPSGAAQVAFQRVESEAELERALQAAAGKPVMLDFYADWCVSCKEMERFTFPEPKVQAPLRQMVALKADVTANTAEHAALLRRFRLFGPPGIIFFDREGREIRGLRVIGFQSADKFTAVLEQALAVR